MGASLEFCNQDPSLRVISKWELSSTSPDGTPVQHSHGDTSKWEALSRRPPPPPNGTLFQLSNGDIFELGSPSTHRITFKLIQAGLGQGLPSISPLRDVFNCGHSFTSPGGTVVHLSHWDISKWRTHSTSLMGSLLNGDFLLSPSVGLVSLLFQCRSLSKETSSRRTLGHLSHGDISKW